MLNYIRTFWYVLLLVFCDQSLANKVDVTLIVDDNYPPYSFKQYGKVQGVYIDILQAVFQNMPDYNVKLQPLPWPRAKMMVQAGLAFAIAPVFYHGHDWPWLYPYSLSFFEENIIVVCRSDVLLTPRPNWPDDYIGLTIHNIPGFDGWGGKRFRQLVSEKKIVYHEIRGVESNILMLERGRADCILTEETSFDTAYARLLKRSAESEIEREDGNTGVSEGVNEHATLQKGPSTGKDSVYVGYSETAIRQGKFAFHYDFRKQFDNNLYRLKKEGELDRIVKRAFERLQKK